MRTAWATIRAGAWLGWQVEANWADPFLFLVFAIAKPLATTLILFFMVRVVAPGAATADAFLFLFVGNTFFLYVSEVLVGISWAVFRDREDYETLKYIYAAPIRLLPYLIGRGVTKIATASLGIGIALLFGRWVLRLPIGASLGAWGMLVLAVLLGLVAVAMLGIALAGASLIVARHSMNLNEGLTGLFYLLAGTVFPLEILPRWAQAVSLTLPFTYWLELIRRILTGRPYVAALRPYGDGALWGILALSTVAMAAASAAWFAWCERHARSRGLIDWKTNY
ncbi:MAG: ABC transporter permease [Hyphomicrobiales bacterium]